MLLNRTMQTIDPIEAQALSIVSYIGCTVSIICLALTIIFFISFGSVCTSILTSSSVIMCCVYRKKLFVSVNNFVHLNLAAALLAGLIVFVTGIETATSNRVSIVILDFTSHLYYLAP